MLLCLTQVIQLSVVECVFFFSFAFSVCERGPVYEVKGQLLFPPKPQLQELLPRVIPSAPDFLKVITGYLWGLFGCIPVHHMQARGGHLIP